MKATVPSLEAVPESLRPLAEKQDDGTFALPLDKVVPAKDLADVNTKLAEFRENNRALNATKTELETKLAALKDIDPVAHRAMAEELATLKKTAPAKDTELAAIKTQLETLGQQLSQSNKDREAAAAALVRKDLEQQLTTAGIKAGVQEGALPDFLGRGLKDFQVENGQIIAKKFSPKNAAVPITVEEWVGVTVTEAPHLFKSSHGGNAGPGPGGNGNGNGAVRVVPEGARLSAQDIADIAAGKAVRAEASAA